MWWSEGSEGADGMRRHHGSLCCRTTAPRGGDVWLRRVSGFALKMRGPRFLSTLHLQASLWMFPVSPPPTPAPQLQVSRTPVSLLPSESPAGARCPPLLSAGPPQTRLTAASARAGGHPSVLTSLSHAGIFPDRRFFLESSVYPKRATIRSPRCSGKQEKHFCPGNI